jgi:5-methylcytosine-specific restriction endonuclease McrA
MSPAIHRRRLHFIDRVLSDVQESGSFEAYLATDIEAARKEIRIALKSGAEVRRMTREKNVKKAQTQRAEMFEIRRRVWERSCGACENPDCRLPLPVMAGELDHQFGGSGRRRAEQRVETCWRLCEPDHRAKTDNDPDAETWARRFAKHARSYGYHREALMAEARFA